MGARRALGSSVHRPTPDAERQISLVGLHSIKTGVSSVPLHYIKSRREITSEQQRIDVDRMFHHDSTAKKK